MDSLGAASYYAQRQLETVGQSYNQELEWPGDDQSYDSPAPEIDSPDPSRILRSGQPVFRFVVIKSSILPKKQTVAVIDAYPEVQIGRDIQPEGSTTPRIRLKEMEVSKFHATAYWDGARKEWNLVDMGSMHGTYVRSGPLQPDPKEPGTRLSQPRTASLPRRLRHSDQLTIGSTLFEVHIHDDQRPCQSCTISSQEEIPLFPSSRKNTLKRTRDVASMEPGPSHPLDLERNPKRALNTLKRTLLSRHDETKASPSAESSGARERVDYVDRAARRRLLNPATRPDSPGLPTIYAPTISKSASLDSKNDLVLPKPIISAPPTPLPTSNVGHRLLMRQGWSPGTALGSELDSDASSERVRLIDPLEIKHSENRSGLGMQRKPNDTGTSDSGSGLSWKDKEKFKRFRQETESLQ